MPLLYPTGQSGHCGSSAILAGGKNGHPLWLRDLRIIFGQLMSGFRTQIDRVCQRKAPPTYLRCSRSEFSTTETELSAMAAEAIMGFNLPAAATGMATVL